MLTYFCPNCWTVLAGNERNCPQCGFALEQFEEQSYEEKLLAALRHPVPERRMMAAQILGNLKSQRAIAEFKRIVESGEEDYFLLRAVLTATAKIDHPDRAVILEMASRHSSGLVSKLAEELIAQLASGASLEEWDRHTG